MTCDMPHDRLWAWAQGEEEDDAAAAEIASHVEQCAICQDQVEEMQEILGELKDIPTPGRKAASSAPPETVPGYRIIRKIGHGGMGVVFEAEQQSPLRKVALKLILGGAYADEIQIKMFQREVQTLAHLSHPGIAAIHDAGQTDDGQRFFAMELVEGQALSEHELGKTPQGAGNAQSIPRRLRLFLDICEAISYAHQRGIIHRDLKPSNIIITGDEKPKVLDFGLARMMERDAATPTINTETGNLMGTLPYMSPEQAQGKPESTDLRSDVYSLGVILYELLTGQLPCNVARLPLLEAARVICEQPPSPPRTVNPDLPEDLGIIALKALEKESDRRYQSVSALQDDVERYLAGHPIHARPPSTIYQIRKLVARHKAPSLLISLLAVSITVSGIVAVIQARNLAIKDEEKTRIIEALKSFVEDADPSRAGRPDATIKESLDRKAEEIEQELADDPIVAATIRNTIGNLYASLMEFRASEKHLVFALETRERELGRNHVDTAESMNDLGELRYHQDRRGEARRLWEDALAIRRRVLETNDWRIAESLNNLGVLTRKEGKDRNAARHYLEEALTIRERIHAARLADLTTTNRQRKRSQNELAQTLNNLAGLLHDENTAEASAGAQRYYRRALQLREDAFGRDHLEVGKMLNNLAKHLHERGTQEDVPEAEKAYRRALAIMESTEELADVHKHIPRVQHNLARLLFESGKSGEAEPICERAHDRRIRIFGKDHAKTRQSRELLEAIRAALNS